MTELDQAQERIWQDRIEADRCEYGAEPPSSNQLAAQAIRDRIRELKESIQSIRAEVSEGTEMCPDEADGEIRWMAHEVAHLEAKLPPEPLPSDLGQSPLEFELVTIQALTKLSQTEPSNINTRRCLQRHLINVMVLLYGSVGVSE
jgi:hypothetical protein